jgi:Domain of unknown function (DUF4112)
VLADVHENCPATLKCWRIFPANIFRGFDWRLSIENQGSGVQSRIGDRQSKVLEWEVLPPEDQSRSRRTNVSLESLFRWLALIMDDFLRLPGTKLRFGLDPIIGLLPGIGDVTSAIVSAVAFVHAARSGVPKILLARMAMNILINELVGIIPGLGDAFSFWFKSNVRNYELLRRYSAAPAGSRRGDWMFVIAVISLLFVIVCAGLIVTVLVLEVIGRFLFQR